MIHFTKPWLEATGAILFGLFLGVLALRTRTIWGGVLVHVSIAFSMDLAALLQTKGVPHQWWP
jgi:membrane protease YdiL (CAAX protease family)